MSTYGTGLSGGDRIFIELARRLGKKYPVSIYLWEEGLNICKREGLSNVKYILWSAKLYSKFGFFKSVTFVINYFARIFIGLVKAFLLKLENSPATIVYSASEFWQDTIPALILKLRFPKITWIAAWYMTAPHPFKGFKENGSIRLLPDLKALAYWLVQLPIKPLIKQYANFVFVTSEPDKLQFPLLAKHNRIMVVKGGVDLDKIKLFQRKYKTLPKIYDAVFQGRFHPQKGVLELIDIWKDVVKRRPDSKLAMIGDGSLMRDVKDKIKVENLGDNIQLFGYLFDGPKKYKLFQQSKIVVHPALYDSGGMAAAEAMAFGLPGISFDLIALRTYYPKGLIKVPIDDFTSFGQTINQLLDNRELYRKTQKEAIDLVQKYWDWDSLVNKILAKL